MSARTPVTVANMIWGEAVDLERHMLASVVKGMVDEVTVVFVREKVEKIERLLSELQIATADLEPRDA